MPVLAALVLLPVSPACAQDVPRPLPRPGAAAGHGQANAPRPLPRPHGAGEETARAGPETAPEDASVQVGCEAALLASGAGFERVPAIETESACGIERAVELRSAGGVALRPAAILSCGTALTVSRFLRDTLPPVVERRGGAAVEEVFVAASYDCRGRNRVPGARLSEHAFGRAIDIRGFRLSDGSEFAVTPRAPGDGSVQADLQRALRAAACGPFTTVLGPGSDAHHDNHFHFDTKPRRNPYCR